MIFFLYQLDKGQFSCALEIGLPTEGLHLKVCWGGSEGVVIYLKVFYIGMLVHSWLCFVCISNTVPVTSLDLL